MAKIRVIQFHPYDPTHPNVGGIGSIIRALIKFAPSDFDIYFVGVSVNIELHPVGRWQRLELDGRSFHFFPVMAAPIGRRDKIPRTLKFAWALWRHRRQIDLHGAMLEFHRIEPSVVFWLASNHKILFLHGHHGKDYYNPKSEVKWSRFPAIYFWLERHLIARFKQVYIVRADAVTHYQQHYPAMRDCIQFIPTWVDETVFHPLPLTGRRQLKRRFARQHQFDGGKRILLFVGRFVGQKNPLLLLQAYQEFKRHHDDAILVMIGMGELEADMRRFILEQELEADVRILGPRSHQQISEWMNAVDCLCLSSAFEGMPVVLLEALYCGVPVVSTDTGEAARLIPNDSIGRLVREHAPLPFMLAIRQILAQPSDPWACQQQAAPYTAQAVLYRLHSRYRELAQSIDAKPLSAVAR